MMPHEDSTIEPSMIGKLRIGGDWACAHGDFEALRYVALRLSTVAGEPLHRELLELADACMNGEQRATELWHRLRAGPI